jgi:hypothetical protein
MPLRRFGTAQRLARPPLATGAQGQRLDVHFVNPAPVYLGVNHVENRVSAYHAWPCLPCPQECDDARPSCAPRDFR